MDLTCSKKTLASFSSWRVGGAPENLYQPNNISELSELLNSFSREESVLFLGLGSNTLIRDGGFSGSVIITQPGLNKLYIKDEVLLYAESGVSCARLARFAARHGLEGLEFLAGIPGTVGGALAMNAGANGAETWSFVRSVELIDQEGFVNNRLADTFKVNYRHVELPIDQWFVSATFSARRGCKEKALSTIKKHLDYRKATQPIHLANGGCVFRNPPGDFAGRLIDQCGLKGKQVGGAYVSKKHANFIVHEGNATAFDIERLILEIISSVFVKTGVKLIPETRIVGQPLEMNGQG